MDYIPILSGDYESNGLLGSEVELHTDISHEQLKRKMQYMTNIPAKLPKCVMSQKGSTNKQHEKVREKLKRTLMQRQNGKKTVDIDQMSSLPMSIGSPISDWNDHGEQRTSLLSPMSVADSEPATPTTVGHPQQAADNEFFNLINSIIPQEEEVSLYHTGQIIEDADTKPSTEALRHDSNNPFLDTAPVQQPMMQTGTSETFDAQKIEQITKTLMNPRTSAEEMDLVLDTALVDMIPMADSTEVPDDLVDLYCEQKEDKAPKMLHQLTAPPATFAAPQALSHGFGQQSNWTNLFCPDPAPRSFPMGVFNAAAGPVPRPGPLQQAPASCRFANQNALPTFTNSFAEFTVPQPAPPPPTAVRVKVRCQGEVTNLTLPPGAPVHELLRRLKMERNIQDEFFLTQKDGTCVNGQDRLDLADYTFALTVVPGTARKRRR